jgi:predicted nucleic acid-binding protein
VLVIDTTVVVEALLRAQPEHGQCVALLQRLAASDCLVVFNRLLEIELHEALFNLALKEKHGKAWASARHDGRVRRRAGRLLEDGTSAWSDVLDSLSWASVELGEVAEKVPQLMRSYGFRSYDATHAATLEVAGAKDIATLDHGFASLPQSRATLHTTTRRAVTMRGRRKRH